MKAKHKNISLKYKRSTVEIKPTSDPWIYDLVFSANGKVNSESQIIQSDIPGRVESLISQGYVRIESNSKQKPQNQQHNKMLTKRASACRAEGTKVKRTNKTKVIK